MKNTYSFRAECLVDVQAFEAAYRTAYVDHPMSLRCVEDAQYPDVEVELTCEGVRLDQLDDLMRGVPDGHVMLQTLRQCPLADNSLERDYDKI